MIQKKTLPQKKTNLKDKITIVNTMRKSQLTASNEFRIKKLSRPQEGFWMGYDDFSLDNLYYDIQGRVSVESWHVHGLTASTLEKKLFDRVIGRVEDILKERMSKYDVLFKLFN